MKFSYYDFLKIYKSCVKATDKSGGRRILRYIELRAKDGYCVATALDGFVLNQVRVKCEGDGVILIPPVHPPKCVMVEVEKVPNGNVKISYFDYSCKLIYAYELPVDEGAYIKWAYIIPHERQGDRTIYCLPANLLKALECFKGNANMPICISIPKDKANTIAISRQDEQAIVLPVRINDGSYDRYAIKNLYCEVSDDD